MISMAGDRLRRAISGAAARLGPGGTAVFGPVDLCFTQNHSERLHSRRRNALLTMDQQIGNQLALFGSRE